MLIYRTGVYKNCTETAYQNRFKSLGYAVVTPLPDEIIPVEIAPEAEPERLVVPRPQPSPRKGRR